MAAYKLAKVRKSIAQDPFRLRAILAARFYCCNPASGTIAVIVLVYVCRELLRASRHHTRGRPLFGPVLLLFFASARLVLTQSFSSCSRPSGTGVPRAPQRFASIGAKRESV